MTVAKNKEQYINAWNAHVNELTHLGFPLIEVTNNTDNVDYYKELVDIQGRLKELVKIAADQDFRDKGE